MAECLATASARVLNFYSASHARAVSNSVGPAMEEIGSILPKAIQKHVPRGKQPVAVMLAPLWPRVVGKFIANFSRPVAFEDGVLTVAASSPAWVTQLRGMADPVRAQVNDSLGAPVVKKLRFRLESRNGGHRKEDYPITRSPKASRPDAPLGSRPGPAAFPWTERGVHLAPGVAEVVEKSFIKYFSRSTKGPSA